MQTKSYNYGDPPLYLRCGCHTAYHAVVIDRDPDVRDTINVSVVCTRNASLWHRLKWAAIHVFGREDLTQGDLILGRVEVERLRDFCVTITKAGEK